MRRVSDERLESWLWAKGDAARLGLEQLAGIPPFSLADLPIDELRNVAAYLSWQLLQITVDAHDQDGGAAALVLLDELRAVVADLRALRTPVPDRPPAGW